MATTERKTRRKIVLRRATEPDPYEANPLPRRSKWRGRLTLLVVSGLLLAWVAPMVVAKTPLLNYVIDKALADLNGTVQIADASLGWFSPVEVRQVVVCDAAGKPVARVESAMSEETLFHIATHLASPGKFRLEHPRLELVVRDQGSNLEDLVAELLKPKEDAASAGIDLTIEVADGTLVLRDETNGGQWQIDHLVASVTSPSQPTWPMEISASGVLDDSGKQSPLKVAFSLQDVASPDGALVHTGKAAVQIDRLPLAMCQALVRRIAPGAQLAGTLQTKLDGEWGVDAAGQPMYRLVGQTSAQSLTLAGPWLAGDQLRIAQLDLPCQVTCEGDKLIVEQLSATSDIGTVTCQGSLNGLKQLLTGANIDQVLESLKHANGQVTAQLDLAKLAQLLPQTLRVRSDTKITSGLVNVQLGSRDDGARTGWQLQLETSRLLAVHQGVELSWEQPLRVAAAAHEEAKQITIDRLECVSDFLQIEGSGSPTSLRLAAVCDLNRLTQELSRFVHMDGIRLAGQGRSNVSVQASPNGKFQATADAQITKFELAAPGTTVWSEEQLSLAVGATGMWYQGRPASLEKGQATIDAGTDRLQLTLTGPVEDLATGSWPIDAQLSGATASWLRRLGPWNSFRDRLEINGQAQVSAQLVYSPAGVDLPQAQITIQPLKAKIFGMPIEEETAKLTASGRWSSTDQKVEIRQAALEAPPGSITMNNALVMLATGKTGASGNVTLDADIAKLQRWWQDPATVPNWMLSGKLQCQGQLSHTAGTTQVVLDAVMQELMAMPRVGRQIIEPVVKLGLRGSYAGQTTTLSIEQCDLVSDAVELQAAGKIDRLDTTRDLQLGGRVTYDLNKLTRLLQPYLGNQVQMSGRETKSFQLTGPLVIPPQAPAANNAIALAQQLTGKAEAGWQWANFYGFRTGPTKVEAELGRGIVRLIPTEIPIGQGGKLRLGPEGRLGPGAVEVVHAPAKVIEQVEITPEMCQQWLGYVAPLLAGVAETRGRFSVDIDALRVPVMAPKQGDVAGRLTIHDVEIGPGPLVQELAVLLGGGSSAKLSKESVVPFRMVQGRIYHQNLELVFPDVTIRTQGSVGIDETIALLVEMPVPPRWIGNNPNLQGFKDQIIRLPIGGTLNRPQIDRRAMDQVLADMTRNAAENAVRREVNRGIDKLFENIPGLK